WVPDGRREGLKPLGGLASMQALPPWLGSDEARMRWVGCKAHQGRHGGCPRGAAPRRGPRPEGPCGAEPLAPNLVKLHLRELDAWGRAPRRPLPQAGGLGTTRTGLLAATARETTQR